MKLSWLLCVATVAVIIGPAILASFDDLKERYQHLHDRLKVLIDSTSDAKYVKDYQELLSQIQLALNNIDNMSFSEPMHYLVSGLLDQLEKRVTAYEARPKSKRDLIPERDELVERIGRLYDRIRATVNGGYAFGQDALKEALDQLSVTYNRVKNLGSLRWVKRWINEAVTKIEEKLKEYEAQGGVTKEKREVLPPHDEVVAKLEDLYDRLRILINGKADSVLEVYKALLDQVRDMYEKLERFKSLGWLKNWINGVLDKLDAKLQAYEYERTRRDLIPERDELVERIGRLYDRIRATVNGGFAFGQDALKEALDQLSVTYNRVKNLGSLSWVKRWINEAVTKIEEKLKEYEAQGSVTKEKREVLPPHDEVVAKMEDLYDRLRVLINGKADSVLEVYKALLDQARDMYEKLERFKSLGWLKNWINGVLDKLDAKLQEYTLDDQEYWENEEEQLHRRDVLPTNDELRARGQRLYDRVKALMDSASDAEKIQERYQENLYQIQYLVDNLDQLASSDEMRIFLSGLISHAEERVTEYEGRVTHEKREVIPSHEEVIAKLESLYDRIRILINGKADHVLETYKALLDETRDTFEAVERFKSLDWLKLWIAKILDKTDEKLREYELKMGDHGVSKRSSSEIERAPETVSLSRREVIPSKDEVLNLIARLYERLRKFVNRKSDDTIEYYKEALDYVRNVYEKVENFKSLNWLKSWVIRALKTIDNKLNEWELEIQQSENAKKARLAAQANNSPNIVSRREILPSKAELTKRLDLLYLKVRAYVNSGADTALDAYKESLDYIRYLMERFEKIRSFEWMTKWIAVLLDRAEKNLNYVLRKYESSHPGSEKAALPLV